MSLHDDLVSVVIPVYNSEKFLAESIESVLNQTYTMKQFSEIISKIISAGGLFKYKPWLIFYFNFFMHCKKMVKNGM